MKIGSPLEKFIITHKITLIVVIEKCALYEIIAFIHTIIMMHRVFITVIQIIKSTVTDCNRIFCIAQTYRNTPPFNN